jgi:hypothetical protein
MGTPPEPGLRRRALVAKFPRLGAGHLELTSPRDIAYNCIAYAAGDTERCWHPSDFACLYWPGGYTEDGMDAWIAAFETLGYAPCESAELEPGIEKVAIYAQGEWPLHAARQLPSGRWTSKLGDKEDIEHDLEGLAGREYGTVSVILARPA